MNVTVEERKLLKQAKKKFDAALKCLDVSHKFGCAIRRSSDAPGCTLQLQLVHRDDSGKLLTGPMLTACYCHDKRLLSVLVLPTIVPDMVRVFARTYLNGLSTDDEESISVEYDGQ